MTPEHLFKLRTAVARHGELDGAGWWPSQSLLGKQGATLYARAFPRTHPFARARVVAETARNRCSELYPVADAVTLWSLPPEYEEQVELARQEWLRDPEPWAPFFQAVEAHTGGDLLEFLEGLDLLSDQTLLAAMELKAPDPGPALPLPASDVDQASIELLAAAFAMGSKSAPVVPHLGVRR